MYKSVEPIRCPKCGAIVKVDVRTIYLSEPPCYSWTCPKCGEKGVTEKGAPIPFENQTFETDKPMTPMTSGYIQKVDEPDLCVVGVTTTNAMGNDYNTINAVPSIYSTSALCEICGEEFKYDAKHMHICPKCREAVVKIRKLLDGQRPIRILSVDNKEPESINSTAGVSFPTGTDIRLF